MSEAKENSFAFVRKPQINNHLFSWFFGAFLLCSSSQFLQAQSVVTLRQSGDAFSLLRNGQAFPIKGVGGTENLRLLASVGGNAIRTWDTKNLGETLDKAQELGIAVCAGLWLQHQRHGFDYQNQAKVLEQLEELLGAVRQYKDHPALLMWGVGNEMEGEGTDPSVWYAVDHVAREIKEIDPNHPTMTVIAELGEDAAKIRSIEQFCPNIDIIGINSYGGIESIGQRYRTAQSSKPYVITEHGPLGPWETGTTDWGSPIEFTSTEKSNWYANGYRANAEQEAGLCLGSFAFLWGHKQETTATWFGMLLSDGTRLGAVDAMQKSWTGEYPENRCPIIESMSISQSSGKPGAQIKAEVVASDPENDQLTYQWILRSDSATIGAGGDPQESESEFPQAVTAKHQIAQVQLPEGGGGYRLFVYIYDAAGGAAVANIPLQVRAPIKLPIAMEVAPLPYIVFGDSDGAPQTNVYIPSGYMGNASAVSMELDNTDDPYAGKTCLKASYQSNASWGGVLWQSPAGDWDGKLPGGANLTGATHLEFWARGAQGGEKVNFLFGVLNGNQPYRDTAKRELKDVQLSPEWTRYRFDLKDLDLRQIKTGFGWSLEGQGKPVSFYLDEIRYISMP